MRKLIQKGKHTVFMLFSICLLLFGAAAVFAEDEKGSVQVNYPVSGIEFHVYRVGTFDGHDGFILTGDYADYEINLEEESAAATLASYVKRDQLAPIYSGQTGEDGSIKVEDLELGVYLLVNEEKEVDEKIYVAAPILLSIPSSDGNGGRTWDLVINDKYTVITKPVEPISVSVRKVWKNDDSAKDKRPLNITVELLANGRVYDTIVLEEKNNWIYSWDELDKALTWSVVEKEIPEGYKVSVEEKDLSNEDKAFAIVNTFTTPPPENPPKPPIPQTGQLWWPVGILLCAGLLCILIGVIRRRSS